MNYKKKKNAAVEKLEAYKTLEDDQKKQQSINKFKETIIKFYEREVKDLLDEREKAAKTVPVEGVAAPMAVEPDAAATNPQSPSKNLIGRAGKLPKNTPARDVDRPPREGTVEEQTMEWTVEEHVGGGLKKNTIEESHYSSIDLSVSSGSNSDLEGYDSYDSD